MSESFKKLLDWQSAEHGRHFVVRSSNTCVETKYRVIVWVKPEGEKITGDPGEGWGPDIETASEKALHRLENQEVYHRNTSVYDYFPKNLDVKLFTCDKDPSLYWNNKENP